MKYLPTSVVTLLKVSEREWVEVSKLVRTIERLKIKIRFIDYASAILAVFNSWFIYLENLIYQGKCIYYAEGHMTEICHGVLLGSFAFRVLGMILAGLLVFTIIKHYSYKNEMQRL